MSRSVREWVGKTDDERVPDRVKLRIWRRQCGQANFTICPLSGLPLRWTDKKHLHHDKALILGGEHRETNLFWVHAAANSEEAKAEVAIRAKNDSVSKKHAGIATPGPKIQSAGFRPVDKNPNRNRPTKQIPKPRGMFA